MDTNLKVTETPTESSFSDIVAGDNVVNIPLFQREYKWGDKNLKQFLADINAIIDGQKKSQFLGVIVTVPQPKPIGVPPIFDIVDGQQRLFTCYLAVAAAIKMALDNNHEAWAVEAARSFLLLRQHSGYPTNTKIVPSAADRQQFAILWSEIGNHKSLDSAEAWKNVGMPNPPAPSGNQTGKLLQQYRRLCRWFDEIISNGGLEKLESVTEIIVSNLSFVTISLRDPIAAPIIFERLNARGEKITTGDLVRNEIFARVAGDPQRAISIFENYWEPFQTKFEKRSLSIEQVLFPYGLCLNANITKAELFQSLRTHWSTIDTTAGVIADLDRYTETLFALEIGEIGDNIPPELAHQIVQFHNARMPSSIYPFVFKGVEAVQLGHQLPADILEAFKTIEGFLVRRAVSGIEPTGLHAVFKGMWGEIENSKETNGVVNSQSVCRAIQKRSTVPWPDDMQFGNSIKNGNLYDRRIASFVILQYELDTTGETPADGFWIEHILPKTYHKEYWGTDFSEESHKELTNTFSNLIPLTSKMNGAEGQNGYHDKRKAYSESVFSTARNLAKQYDIWTPVQISKRAELLESWAIHRWPKS